ncbi:hypothetical protein PV08_04201 [Exophiala spinifera]|uniref:Zn(2)-C6 fungal-type domain-containing protein n=1 Tax=Exophiala spinifera TaxID=91928 RepID=A0A0D2BEM1_9EURO|nr:uncharacterized protein PV08_04201 [Exophiala spinifera]KIW17010.1 hypothetical protein PV08_04201 [Exophiala spinifera]
MANENCQPQPTRPRKRRRGAGIDEIDNASGTVTEPIRRASRACDQCRLQKKRCDSGHPCDACAKTSLDCRYGQQSKKRGFATGYVHIVEALWALVFKAVPGSQEATLRLLQRSNIGYDDEGKASLFNLQFDAVDSSRKAWLSSSIRHEIDKLVSNLEDTTGDALKDRLQPETGKEGKPSAPLGTNFSPWSIPADGLEDRRSSKRSRKCLDMANINSRARSGTAMPLTALGDIHEPLPPDAWKLIETYFKFSHSWLPITQKHSIVRTLTEVQDGVAHSSRRMGLLWAVLATASMQHHQQQPAREQEHPSISEIYYNEAIKSIPGRSSSLDPDHVKALVQLAVLDIARRRWDAAFLILRRAIRAILHFLRVYQDRPGDNPVDSAFLRTVLAAFSMDTLLAARSGTIPQLRSQEVRLALQYDENEADEWELCSSSHGDSGANIQGHAASSERPLRTLSIFKHYVKLLFILNESVCDLCPFKDDQAKLRDSLDKLGSWKSHLPRHCRQCQAPVVGDNGQQQQQQHVLPAVANLHLTAEAVSLFVRGRQYAYAAGIPCEFSRLESFTESGSMVRSTYQRVFGAVAWSGVLDFHEYSSRLRCKAVNTQMSTASVSDVFGYPDVRDTTSYDCSGIEIFNVDPGPEYTLTNIEAVPPGQCPVTGGLFLSVLDDIMTDQNPQDSDLASTELRMPELHMSAGSFFASFDIPQSDAGRAHSCRENPRAESISDDTSITALLDELSETQNKFDWMENEVPSMSAYNPDFMQGDPIT